MTVTHIRLTYKEIYMHTRKHTYSYIHIYKHSREGICIHIPNHRDEHTKCTYIGLIILKAKRRVYPLPNTHMVSSRNVQIETNDLSH